MKSLETQEETRERVVALIAKHTGATPESIDGDSSLWDYFPRSAGKVEHPIVTSFVKDVHTDFNVYLTEDEWENPTPDSLAENIRVKRENPAASIADWTKDRADLKSGTIGFAVFILALFPAVFVFGSGPRTTRIAVGLALPVVFTVMLLVGYRRKVRELDASAPRR